MCGCRKLFIAHKFLNSRSCQWKGLRQNKVFEEVGHLIFFASNFHFRKFIENVRVGLHLYVIKSILRILEKILCYENVVKEYCVAVKCLTILLHFFFFKTALMQLVYSWTYDQTKVIWMVMRTNLFSLSLAIGLGETASSN